MKIVLRTLCSDTKTQEKPATWKIKIPCTQQKKTFSKDLKTQLLGEQLNQHHHHLLA